MNPLLANVILSSYRKGSGPKSRRSGPYRRDARKRYRTRQIRYTVVRDAILLLAGIASAGFGLNGFLIPNHFIDGGATGISLMLVQLTPLPLSVLLVLVNLPFMFLAFTQVSKLFALKTALAIIGLAICVAVVPYPVMTQDKLLIPVFGGFFLGAGIGLAVRGGGVLDGTEVLAIYLSKKTNLSIGDIILIFNILIFIVANFLLSTNIALYAIITYFVASKTVDFIIEGIDEYTGVTIISRRSEEISQWITGTLGAGITVYKGVRGYGKSGHVAHDTNILYTVITRLEVSRLKSEIKAIDPRAFIIMNAVIDAKGGMIRKKAVKKLQKPDGPEKRGL